MIKWCTGFNQHTSKTQRQCTRSSNLCTLAITPNQPNPQNQPESSI